MSGAFLTVLVNAVAVHSDRATSGTAAVFASLDEALRWFHQGPLTTELLRKLGRLEPEFVA